MDELVLPAFPLLYLHCGSYLIVWLFFPPRGHRGCCFSQPRSGDSSGIILSAHSIYTYNLRNVYIHRANPLCLILCLKRMTISHWTWSYKLNVMFQELRYSKASGDSGRGCRSPTYKEALNRSMRYRQPARILDVFIRQGFKISCVIPQLAMDFFQSSGFKWFIPFNSTTTDFLSLPFRNWRSGTQKGGTWRKSVYVWIRTS